MIDGPATHSSLRDADVGSLRRTIRLGHYTRHTAGLADGRLQCNLAIVPEAEILDFLRFCLRNPQACPVVGVTDTGNPAFFTLGEDIDLRTDVPKYIVYRDGVAAEQVTDLLALWRDDLVAVALGCSFTFERALMAAGIPVRHIEADTTVPMFRTNRACVTAGPFVGEMVVTMRPIREADIARAIEISGRYPIAHGAPVHVGDPAGLGIADLSRPDYGEPVRIEPGEVPVFWACGVTPQNVLLNARLPFCITHAPGHMLITDVDETAAVPMWQANNPIDQQGD